MTRFEPTIDVPPLSDVSRQRIRQAVFERLDRETAAPATPSARRSRWRVAAALAAVALIGIGLGARRFLGGDRLVAIPSVSRLVTGDSPTEVTAAGARILAGPHSALDITESAVILERGEIEIHVAPRRGGPPFVVVAAGVRVEVIGTVFVVARHGDRVRVAVRKGLVSVTSGREVVQVAAGAVWPADPATQVEEPVRQLQEPVPASTGEASRPAVPASVPASPAPPRRAGRRPRTSRAAAAPTARERYEAAARLEQTRPEEALTAYRALSAAAGPWAENALFAQARLELEMGRRDAAHATLRSYLRRYPNGSNVALARALLDGAK